ncbi:MAG: histidinol-phosphatase [Litoreibacter sp.]|nr:histidinol-phosphatase [Litoreibacter sp.]
MDEKQKSDFVDLAHRLADAAKAETLSYFRGGALATQSKGEVGFDPVTAADRAAERIMREMIEAERPDDGILGEEFGPKESASGLTWVLDPIDGTRGYISGTPTWGTLIALHDGSQPVVGLIDQPYIGERFTGAGELATFSGPHGSSGLQVSATTQISNAVIFTTFPEIGSATEQAAFHALASECRLTRYGMDCYAYALLAMGQIDLVIEAGLHAYDIQAPIAVIEAAGGIVTTWGGGAADQGGRVIAAATPQLHEAALEVLARHV